jgi:hypothetical protein
VKNNYMIFKAFSRASLILLLSVGASAAFAQTREASSSGVLLDRVAATVNEGVVLSSELDEQMFAISERLRAQNLDLPPQNVLRQQVLDRLVLQELQMQRANRAGIKVSDETLNNALRDVAEQNKIPLAVRRSCALNVNGAAGPTPFGAPAATKRKSAALKVIPFPIS